MSKRILKEDFFPGGTADRNLPANAWVQSLVQEESTCPGTTKTGASNYWAHEPQLKLICVLRACAPQQEKPPQWEACALQQRIAFTHCNQRPPACRNWRPSTAKNKYIILKIKKKNTVWKHKRILTKKKKEFSKQQYAGAAHRSWLLKIQELSAGGSIIWNLRLTQ